MSPIRYVLATQFAALTLFCLAFAAPVHAACSFTLSTSKTDTSCNGGSNGTASVTPSVAGPYSYVWSPSGGTAASASGLAAGSYTVSVTDSLSCQETATVIVNEPSPILLSSGGVTNISCNGGSNGSATVVATGGTGAYTYSWSPSGGNSATASGLTRGTYAVVVSDANTCQAIRNFNITQPNALDANTSSTAVSCFGGSNGSATVAPFGGTPGAGYTYSWSPSGGTGATASGLTAGGPYSVTITDANFCTTVKSFNIGQPAAPLAATTAQINLVCANGTTGQAGVTASGGTGAYTYNWSPSGGTAAIATGLTTGSYSVRIRDANLCEITKNFTLSSASPPIVATTSGTNVAVNGTCTGTATVNASGGNGALTYLWSPSGGSGATATSRCAGTYTPTVTDASACKVFGPSVAILEPPSAPGIGAATPGNGQVSVAFTIPASDGGSAILDYTATCGVNIMIGAGSPLAVPGLANGTPYTCTVKARNAVGPGAVSATSSSVTPRTVSDAPVIGLATGGNAQASVAFTAPAFNGGAPITTYTVTSNPGAIAASGPGTPIVVPGLANGTAYTFTVTATNAAGIGVASTASNSVTPATVPGAPTVGTATVGNAQVSVPFTAPVSNGGSVILDYTATCGATSITGAGSPIVVAGLTNGTAYTCTVTARNASGSSVPSAASNSVTPSTVPGAPTIGAATAGNAQASVTFTAPASNGGSAITSYTVTSNPGGLTSSGAASPLVVAGLTNDTAYTFTVTATNANGAGPASAASAAVTPASPISVRLVNLSARGRVLTGDDRMIGGFSIGGSTTKRVAIVATGPSLAAYGVANPLANPTIILMRSSDQSVVASSDDWQSAPNATDLAAAGFAPSSALEAALLVDLAPGAYTAIVQGAGDGIGMSVMGVYEVNHPETPLINISMRGGVFTGNDVMIGGFIVSGDKPKTLAIAATGPSLASFGITNPLANPKVTVLRMSDQAVVASNDDWQTDANAAQLAAAGFAPSNPLEAALLLTLQPGAYTVIVQGAAGGTGVAVLGVYSVQQ